MIIYSLRVLVLNIDVFGFFIKEFCSTCTGSNFWIFQVSLGIGVAVLSDDLGRLGLFTLECCPGGTGSNFWTVLVDGDLDLSITMTTVSSVAAIGEFKVQGEK